MPADKPLFITECDYLSIPWSQIMSAWWRHQIETLPVLLALCEGRTPLTRPSDAELWCFLWSWTNVWANHRDSGDLRRYPAHYDLAVMKRSYGTTNNEMLVETSKLVSHFLYPWYHRYMWLPGECLNPGLVSWFFLYIFWIIKQNAITFIQEIGFENVVCKMSAILFRHQYVESKIWLKL